MTDEIIFAKGVDITFRVKYYDFKNGRCNIVFDNGERYSYRIANVRFLKTYKVLDCKHYTVVHGGKEMFDIQSIRAYPLYRDEIWQIAFGNGKVCNYRRSELDVKKSVLDDKASRDCLHYLSRMADLNDLTDEDGNKLLAAQFRKVTKVNNTTALSRFLNPRNKDIVVARSNGLSVPIFPFGCNASQYQAVKNALNYSESIIEGPPGTGKTQTILNIIANLVIEGKTVQVVSNNNAAIDNVLEKMSEKRYGIGFIAARLGSRANKDAFLSGQTGTYPDLRGWRYRGNDSLKDKIQLLSSQLADIYANQRALAAAKTELQSLKVELDHFVLYCKESGFDPACVKMRKAIPADMALRFLQTVENTEKISLFAKIKGFLIGIGNLRFYNSNNRTIINAFRYAFYRAKIEAVSRSVERLEQTLLAENAKEKEDRLRECSLFFLQDYLYQKYAEHPSRTVFDNETLFRQPDVFRREYPVVLSTAFSALNTVPGEFDYVIIDEASQADIPSGVLVLCSAKNVVVVGDSCQLPFVLSEEKKKIAEAVFRDYKLNAAYDFSKNSFLDSAKGVFRDAPVTLLREHYRCEPRIIGFCNEKFYNGNLIIMTNQSAEPSLAAYKTAAGNHARGKYNQRQIDVIVKEILPSLCYPPEEIGIIAPYNEQIDRLTEAIGNDKIKIATVHKFQGREKKVILFCTVDNEIREFVDDPKLLNVAVSRAEEKFILITGDRVGDGNISDLLSYIKYHNLELKDSKVYSVFDLLYQANTERRMAYLSTHKKVSQYDSENLMYAQLTDLLESDSKYAVACHVPLGMMIRERERMNEREKRYVANPYAHVDFLIYNKVSKKPILVIEVDGYAFHKTGTKQADRDKIKDAVLAKYRIPFLRFATNGSDERKQIQSALLHAEKNESEGVNMTDITFRAETPEDHETVERLIREAFWNVYRPGCSEHYVIHVLRNDPAFVKELDFVMERDGELIGQNMFMKTVIEADGGGTVDVLTMGPICITPALKRKGYGKKLLDYSLEKAAEAGFGAVLFEGNIGFYGKSGFDYARKFGIRYHDLPEGADDSFFLCKELIPGYLDGVTGVYQTPRGYYADDADVEAFDKNFPPKQKLKLPGQIF